MSFAYEFRKIYADCVTSDGEVFVVYLNYVRLGGVWSGRASVERYTVDGARQLAHARSPAPLVDGDTPVADLPLAVDLGDARFRLDVEVVQGGWDPPTPPPVEALHWRVRAARTAARVVWGGREVSGTGYVDYVQITRPTRLLGLHTLRWGRAHLPDRTVVIEHLDTTAGRVWDTGVEWGVGGTPRTLSAAEIGPDGAGGVDLADGRLALSPLRVLHDGDAFDPERVPSRLDRLACAAFGGATHETRWVGQATHLGRQSLALYESVRFGGQP